jgi:phage terminase small subunit
MAKKLTKKQQVFVAEYLKDLDGKRAAISAGYSAKTAESQASQLLKNPKVSEFLEKKLGKRLQKLEISADYVLENIKDTIERCQQVRPVLDRSGNQVYVETPDGTVAPAYGFQPKAVLTGLELLGKYLKLFTDKVEHSGTVTLEGLVCGTNDDDNG